MIPVVVQSGDTLSGIAAQYGTTYQAIAADSPNVSNPNLIYAGETVNVPTGGGGSVSVTPTTPAWTPPSQQAAPASSSSGGFEQSSYNIPGMPQSDANCIAFRESTDGQASSNVFQILPSSGYNVAGDSLAQQEQVAGELYAQYGMQPWAPSDGC